MSSQLIEFIILFAIAAFVLYRLRSVIGTRTGYEPPPGGGVSGGRTGPAPGPRPVPDEDEDDEMDAAAVRALTPEARRALMDVRAVEADFSLEEFLQGARQAYEMIVTAFSEGDRATLQDLLTPDVYGAFEGVIRQREQDNLSVEFRFIGVRDVRVEALRFDAETAEADITLRFVGETVTVVRDSENRVVEGDPNDIHRQTDFWTFSRVMGAPNPNWLLSATGE